MSTTIAIHGAAGRMGRRLVALAAADADLTLTAAADAPGHPDLGRDAGELAGAGKLGVPLTEALVDPPAVVIDFSLPEGTRRVLPWCVEHRVPLVLGTTGLSDADDAALAEAANTIPLLRATNFSLVVNVLHDLIKRAAPLLGDDYDIEIMEAHHRFKKDAPSGTALSLAQTVCAATGRDFGRDVLTTRSGDAVPRQPNEVTVQAIRIGDHPGEHTVYFAAPGERLELKHVSTSRDSYALGALRAAKWLARQSAGRYDMKDVLGL
ncbi:MAG: 4-hydroxy-tetrahydrodipicolinate reductase [Planctomycetes bacterium]|jgi:4-hydroxy-tetrahydrodipicolinate reductase|nr:4-hydroxy-tetrahydrodipicolinate reductase [Planctomycetota bacterium]